MILRAGKTKRKKSIKWFKIKIMLYKRDLLRGRKNLGRNLLSSKRKKL